ncbi:hypothetical protein [Aquicella lusitana]|uniref:Uncharacterized protein n=1 Tax=Aquicella lusitana TaxID=254246 RepID=A0A370GGS1_9COXI|nr:hypothetical protein [Aquicella lusitana]RDI42446.1 hypothetical protein C8D86_11550 [Aquicella lusitana]VVC74092.1 hypothetical protein AQULUS_18560 [Aquicella lusitana]
MGQPLKKFIPLATTELIQRVNIVRSNYKNKNPSRLELIEILDTFQSLVGSIGQDETRSETETQEIAMGAWVYCLEIILQEYYLLSPEHKPGYVFNTGSTLYSILLEQLDINEENLLEDHDKLRYLEKFYYYFLNDENVDMGAAEALEKKQLSLSNIKKQSIELMKNILKRMSTEIAHTVNAIPTEQSIDNQMSHLHTDFKKDEEKGKYPYPFSLFQSQNENHEFLTQLAEALTHIKVVGEENLPPNTMSRAQKIKMGLLLYIMLLIENEYSWRSPTNDPLYVRCSKMLNVACVKNYNHSIKLACISALETFLSDKDCPVYLENYGRQNFKDKNLLQDVDAKLIDLRKGLENSRLNLQKSPPTSWPITKTMYGIGEMIGAAPGYGLGYVVGYTASETNKAVPTKIALSKGVSYIGTAFFGQTSGCLGFLAADFIVASTLTRAFAKVFEQIGKLLGGATLGMVGLTVELSWSGLQNLCNYFFHLHTKIDDPELISKVDPEIVKTLAGLPLAAFDKQEHINRLVYGESNLNFDAGQDDAVRRNFVFM